MPRAFLTIPTFSLTLYGKKYYGRQNGGGITTCIRFWDRDGQWGKFNPLDPYIIQWIYGREAAIWCSLKQTWEQALPPTDRMKNKIPWWPIGPREIFFSRKKGAQATGASQPLLRYLPLSLYLSLSSSIPYSGSIKGFAHPQSRDSLSPPPRVLYSGSWYLRLLSIAVHLYRYSRENQDLCKYCQVSPLCASTARVKLPF